MRVGPDPNLRILSIKKNLHQFLTTCSTFEDVLLWFEMPGPGSGPVLRPPPLAGAGSGGGRAGGRGRSLAILVLIARRVGAPRTRADATAN